MDAKQASRLIKKRFRNAKIISCAERDDFYDFELVPKGMRPITRNGISFYECFDNLWSVDRRTGLISALSSLPDDVDERAGQSRIIYDELKGVDDGTLA